MKPNLSINLIPLFIVNWFSYVCQIRLTLIEVKLNKTEKSEAKSGIVQVS